MRMHSLHALLRLAYSAERAAAFAYYGHARSVRSPAKRVAISAIAGEEWLHRSELKRMMERLGIAPSQWLELHYAAIGSIIAASCFVIGWFMPMYFAGRLESGNVNEYLRMEELVVGTAIADEQGCIHQMALVEKQHEEYFLEQVRVHPALPLFQALFGWGLGRSRNPVTTVAPGTVR